MTRRELVAPWFHRPVARRLLPLIPGRVSPTAVTVVAFVLTLTSAVSYALPAAPWSTWAAGLLLLVATVLDAADGELARARGQSSARGAWLDTVFDKVGDAAVGLAITFAFVESSGDTDWWPVGAIAVVAPLIASYMWKEHDVRFNDPPPVSWLDLVGRRDTRTFVLVVGTLLLVPFWTLVALGVVAVVAILRALVVVGRP